MAGFLRISQDERRAAHGHVNVGAGVLLESSFSREVSLQNYPARCAPMERDRAAQRPSKTEATFHKSMDDRAFSNPLLPGATVKSGIHSQIVTNCWDVHIWNGREVFFFPSGVHILFHSNAIQENPKRGRQNSWLFPQCPQLYHCVGRS